MARPPLRRPNSSSHPLRAGCLTELNRADCLASRTLPETSQAFYAAIETQEGEAGRNAIDPRLLISLWVYAYSQGVSSAREVSRLMEYHPGFQWLSGMRVVNHHTLSDFRIRHAEALDELFTQVLGILSAEGLVTLERVMHDGTKIKAIAGSDSFRREERLKEHLRLAKEQVVAMGDPGQSAEVSPRVQAARERAARERQTRLEQALVELEKIRQQPCGDKAPDEQRASLSDPEARIMKFGAGGYGPAYNVQLSTDSRAGAVVDVAVSQSPADAEQLPAAVDRLQERLGEKPDQMVADAEYTTNATILANEGTLRRLHWLLTAAVVRRHCQKPGSARH